MLIARLLIFYFFFFVQISVRAWEIDWSRRSGGGEDRLPASSSDTSGDPLSETSSSSRLSPEPSFVTSLMNSLAGTSPSETVVILHTESGFIPQQVFMKTNCTYKVYIVNVDSKEKNTSFVAQDFGKYQGTYYGEINSFTLIPRSSGRFAFSSPETGRRGHFVVVSPKDSEKDPELQASLPSSYP